MTRQNKPMIMRDRVTMMSYTDEAVVSIFVFTAECVNACLYSHTAGILPFGKNTINFTAYRYSGFTNNMTSLVFHVLVVHYATEQGGPSSNQSWIICDLFNVVLQQTSSKCADMKSFFWWGLAGGRWVFVLFLLFFLRIYFASQSKCSYSTGSEKTHIVTYNHIVIKQSWISFANLEE